MSLLFLFYGALAALAFWATYRDEYLRWIGVWLCLGWVASNVLDFSHVSVPDRIGPYTGIEVMVATAAAWAIFRRSRLLTFIMMFNLLSIAANIGLALNFPSDERQIYLWKVTTNLCFAGECLFAFGIGVGHGYRIGRFRRWFSLRGRAASVGVAKEGDR